MTHKIETALVISDLHVPYHSINYVKIITKIIKTYEPNQIIIAGDLIDFWQISKFNKDLDRKESIYDDLITASKILDVWQNIIKPSCKVSVLQGNHCERLYTFICRRCPELYKMIPTIPTVLGINFRNKENGEWKYYNMVPFDGCRIHDTVITHGVYYSVHTAGNNLVKYNQIPKIVTGHTHRGQLVYGAGGRFSATIGHGCDASQIDYIKTPTDWQQAFAWLTFIDGVGGIEIIPVEKNFCVFRGEVITSK